MFGNKLSCKLQATSCEGPRMCKPLQNRRVELPKRGCKLHQAAGPSLRGFEERLPRHGVVERLALKSLRYFGSGFKGAGTDNEPGQKP